MPARSWPCPLSVDRIWSARRRIALLPASTPEVPVVESNRVCTLTSARIVLAAPTRAATSVATESSLRETSTVTAVAETDLAVSEMPLITFEKVLPDAST
jgi:hypothetical protein